MTNNYIASSFFAVAVLATSALAQGTLTPAESDPLFQSAVEDPKRNVGIADTEAPGKNIAEKRICDSLDEETKFEFTELPLTDAIKYIGHLHKIQIKIDAKSLEDAGLGSDIPITKSLGGIKLRSALRLMLNDLELTYVIQDEVLLITTLERALDTLDFELYPIRAFLDAGWDMEAVKRIIKQHTGGNCEVLGGNLAVTQSQAAQIELRELMRQLNEAVEKDKKATEPPYHPR